jgi:hypothetical protein
MATVGFFLSNVLIIHAEIYGSPHASEQYQILVSCVNENPNRLLVHLES